MGPKVVHGRGAWGCPSQTEGSSVGRSMAGGESRGTFTQILSVKTWKGSLIKITCSLVRCPWQNDITFSPPVTNPYQNTDI